VGIKWKRAFTTRPIGGVDKVCFSNFKKNEILFFTFLLLLKTTPGALALTYKVNFKKAVKT
jgi:hypothetical protein